MIVELYGLPGAGKTTLARDIAAQGRLSVVNLSLFARLFWWKIYGIRYFPRIMRFLGAFVRYAHADRYSRFLVCAVDRHARWMVASRHGGVLDEGPIQNTLSLPERALSHDEMRELVSTLPRPSLLVALEADDATRKERQEERGRVARNADWEAYARQNYHTAMDVVAELGIPTVVYTGNELSRILSRIGS